MRHTLFAAVLMVASATTAEAAETWADTAGNDPQFAASKALCAQAKSVKLPAATTTSAPAGCDSSDLLYGVGRPADPAAARACALHELATGDENPLHGAGALATIYANGSGVPRNYEIAIAYACRIGGASFEEDGWVKHLASLKAKGPGAQPFDICDDITSGMAQGACAERSGAIADAARATEIATLAAKVAPAARAAFDKLRAAEQAFVKSSADNEVDVSGTGRGAFIVESQQAHDKAFVETLRKVLDGTLDRPAVPAVEADKKLNAAYTRLMTLKDTSSLGTVKKSGIREAQRLWLAYRDAFLAFAKVGAPGVPADSLLADLTSARTKDFTSLLGE